MLKNYFKTALRNLWRYKGYAFVNIIGLGVGIAAMVWGYQDYRFSFSFDNFHPDIDQLKTGNQAANKTIFGSCFENK